MGARLQTSHLPQFLRHTMMPLFLIVACPPIAILMWYTCTQLDGSLALLWGRMLHHGLLATIWSAWAPVFWGSKVAWSIIAIYAISQLALMRLLPGRRFEGPITPQGNIPVYKANGISAYFTTLALFCTATWGVHLFPPTLLYDHLGELVGALNLFSLFLCLLLYCKGRYFPSTSDAKISGNLIFDYYWGTELYPRIAGWDIKMFTNCRFGMMGWALLLLSFAAKQQQLYGFLSNTLMISVALQLLYISKFFIWETGYLRSLDIMHDQAGFYICWGCLVWVPAIYTSPALFMVQHPFQLPFMVAMTIFVVGTLAILTNYMADRQRQMVRIHQGACRIWGRKPEVTHANYTTEGGEKKSTLLLASGFWGVARHFHYVPEVAGALCWTLPALFSYFLPYFYLFFLMTLLIERAIRDDKRCAEKYGEFWDLHCQKVRYKILPYLF